MVSVSSLKYSSQVFTGHDKTEKPSPAEKFLSDVEKTVAVQEKGNFFTKYMWSTTAAVVSCVPIVGYELYTILKARKLRKSGDKNAIQNLSNKFYKTAPLLLAVGIAVYAGLEYLFSLNKEEKCKKFIQDFVDINSETEAKLRDRVIRSSYLGAMCSAIGEEITINQNLILDPINNRKLKKLVRHELVHAKQYETIARSENGIKKLNFAVLKATAQQLNNPAAIQEIEDIYRDIMSDKTGKYENKIIHIIGADVDMKKYITGIRTLHKNENAGYDDVPVIINTAHYEKLIKDKGELTDEQKDKAEQYYQAMLNYPQTTFWNLMNPFSSYYDNLLEQEAYKENPNLMTFIRHLFGKD